MKNDRSEWVLKAKDATYSDDKTSLLLTAPEVIMVDKDGKRVDLTASAAKLTMDGNHIKSANMTGGVTVHYGDFVVTTASATFTPDSDDLEAPGPVQIESPDLQVTGIGLKGHPRAQIFQLQQQVNTRITPRRQSDQAKAS
jgi:LPS export ABC transporter protein LptC